MAAEGSDAASIVAGSDTVSLGEPAVLVPGGASHLIIPEPGAAGGIAAAAGNTSLYGGGFGPAFDPPPDGGARGAAAGLVFAHGSVGADLIPLAPIPPEAGVPPLPAPVPAGGQSSLLTLADKTQLLFITIGARSDA